MADTTQDSKGKGEETAIVSPGMELLPTHPLQRTWTLWYDRPDRKTNQDDWLKSLKRVYDIATVEDFWAVMNNIAPASELRISANYHLFLKGVKPAWEDPANENGGKWVITLQRGKSNKTIDSLWMYTMMSIVGESFEHSDEICGAVCSARKKHDRVAVWTADAATESHCVAIGRAIKTFCELPPNFVIGYQVHADCIRRNRSFSNADRYTV